MSSPANLGARFLEELLSQALRQVISTNGFSQELQSTATLRSFKVIHGRRHVNRDQLDQFDMRRKLAFFVAGFKATHELRPYEDIENSDELLFAAAELVDSQMETHFRSAKATLGAIQPAESGYSDKQEKSWDKGLDNLQSWAACGTLYNDCTSAASKVGRPDWLPAKFVELSAEMPLLQASPTKALLGATTRLSDSTTSNGIDSGPSQQPLPIRTVNDVSESAARSKRDQLMPFECAYVVSQRSHEMPNTAQNVSAGPMLISLIFHRQDVPADKAKLSSVTSEGRRDREANAGARPSSATNLTLSSDDIPQNNKAYPGDCSEDDEDWDVVKELVA